MKPRGWIRLLVLCAGCWVIWGMSRQATSAQQARNYKIIAAESSLWVYVAKGGLLSAFAHNHNIGVASFQGTVTVPANGAADGSLRLEIDAKSLNVADKGISEKDRAEIAKSMHSEVLHSEKYPKIVFASVGVSEFKAWGGDNYSFLLQGDLTLHGTTKRITVPVTAAINAQTIKAAGKYVLRQSSWGITPYSKAGGAVKVKDEVVVNFSVTAKAV